MSRVTFTFTATCPEQDYNLVVTARLDAPAPECGDPGGWRVERWIYNEDHLDEFPAHAYVGDRQAFQDTFGIGRLDVAELMAGDAAILRYEADRIEGSDRA